jgi:hypothetical protein
MFSFSQFQFYAEASKDGLGMAFMPEGTPLGLHGLLNQRKVSRMITQLYTKSSPIDPIYVAYISFC